MQRELTSVDSRDDGAGAASDGWEIRASGVSKCRATRQIPRRPIQASPPTTTFGGSLTNRFIDSESDLDSMLKQFLPLTQNPGLFYPELVKSGAITLFTNILSHENTDIAIDVIEVIQELTDEDVGAQEDDIEEEEAGEGKMAGTRMAMAELIDELVSAPLGMRLSTQLNNSILDLLVANLARLNESEETDERGVFQILGVFENLLSFMPPLAEQIVAETTLMPWLLKRIAVKEYESNKQYASEILAILVQDSRTNILKLSDLEGMEVLLTVLAVRPASVMPCGTDTQQYRKKDPSDGDEVEFMENIFNSLCSTLAEPEIKQQFLDSEGVELMIIMMK